MKSVTTVEAKEQFAEIINRSSYGKERIVFTRRGKKIAALVPLEDLKTLELMEDQLDLKLAQESLNEIAKKGTISLEEFKKANNL